MEHRICTKCDVSKDETFFTRRKTHRPGKLVSVCTPCKVAYNSQYRKENSEKVANIERKSKFKKQYGITLEDYNEMLVKQNGTCAICKTDTPNCRTKFFAVDHCHTTGKVRGLLCSSCNRGLGLFKDNVCSLLKAIDYLKGD